MCVYHLTSLFSCRLWKEVRKKQETTALLLPLPQNKIHSLPVFKKKKEVFQNEPEEGLGRGEIRFGYF